MGSGGSKQIIKQEDNIVTNVLTDVIVDITSKCNTSLGNDQSVSDNQFIFDGISGSTLDVQVVQDVRLSLNAMCTSGNETQTKLINEFANKLQSKVEQKMNGLGIANTNEIDKINEIVTNIKTNINMKSLTECLAKVSNDQKMFNNIIKFENINNSNITFSLRQYIVNKVVNNCILSNTSLTASIAELENKLKDETSQSITGFDLNAAISNVINGIGMMWVILLGVILFVLVFAPKTLCIIPGSQVLLGTLCSSNNKKKIYRPYLPNY